MIRFIFLLLIYCFVLSACTTAPKGPENAVNLTVQLEKVAQVQQWEMRGKIAFRQGKDAASLNLVWKNDSGDFDFRLTNFLGVSLVNLDVSQHQSILKADGETYVDALPEPLIYQITGMIIPVDSLLSWVKGLPLRGDKFTLTEKGLVDTLESYCQGCRKWQVAYSNYGSVELDDGTSVWLPHSITLTQKEIPDMPKTQLKIKIYQWTL